jgi:hypothetical protein
VVKGTVYRSSARGLPYLAVIFSDGEVLKRQPFYTEEAAQAWIDDFVRQNRQAGREPK